MENILGNVLGDIEDAGASFSEQAYTIISRDIQPLLQVLLVLYVAYYGLQLLTGTARLGPGSVVGRIVRMMAVLVLVSQWDSFNLLFYSWIDGAPEIAGRELLGVSGTKVTDPLRGLSAIWNTANEAAAVFSEQTGYEPGLPALIGFLLIISAGLLVGVALAILILAKVMLWVLIGTAPIFIACMLFERTRGYGQGWISQVLVYVLTPLFVYVVAAFLIVALDPYMQTIQVNTFDRRLILSDFAAFILLCIAGAIVLVQVQLHAHGIAHSIESGVGSATRRIVGGDFGRVSTSRPAALAAGVPFRGPPAAGAYNRDAGFAEAMQNRISSNSMPR